MMSSRLPLRHAHKRYFEEIEATMQVSDGVVLAHCLKHARVNCPLAGAKRSRAVVAGARIDLVENDHAAFSLFVISP
jgi:hypothetical protein